MISYLSKKIEAEYHQLSLWYFVSFTAGIIFYFKTISNDFFYELLVSIICFSIPCIFFYKRILTIHFFSCCLLFFIIGLFCSNNRLHSVQTKPIENIVITNIQGEIESLKPTLRGTQAVLINNITDISRTFQKVRINISNKLTKDLNSGDIVELRVKLFPLQTSVLPGSYDFGFYMRMSGIEASGYALTSPQIISNNLNTFSQYIKIKRQAIYQRLIDIMGDENGNFAAAILIGETKAIPKDISENMRNSGVAHILSVSGLHLSLVAMIFFVCSRMLLNISNYLAYNINVKITSAIISILGSFLYLQISGNNIAATRAFIMTSIFIGSIMFDRSPHPLRSVIIAAFLILCFLPEYIFHPSFQLSFTAVLCLISGYEINIKNKKFWDNKKGLFSSVKFYFFTNIYSSFLASTITAPFVIYHFYKFANYSVIMNLIAVPLMSFFMMPLALLAIILMPLGFDVFPLKMLSFCISIITGFADFIVKQPYAISYIGQIDQISLAIFTFGFFWLCLWKTNWRFFGLIIMLAACFLIYKTKTPYFLYDHNIKAVAINEEENTLAIYTDQPISKFTSDYWASWFGKKYVKVIYSSIHKKNSLFVINNGFKVGLNYTSCQDADISIIISKKLQCPVSNIITNQDLLDERKKIIYCDSKDNCQ